MKFIKNQLPLRRISKLWHVGSLNAADKGNDSQEGNGLSVSLHPEDWARIAKLGDQFFTMTRKGGTFLDAYAMNQSTRQSLETWGISQRYLHEAALYELTYVDDDEDVRFTLYTDEAKAQAEADFLREEGEKDVKVEPTVRLVLTDSAVQRVGFKQSIDSGMEMIAAFWVEDCTPLDGVWWNDRYAPNSLSAPRGVINLKQLPQWKVSGPQRL